MACPNTLCGDLTGALAPDPNVPGWPAMLHYHMAFQSGTRARPKESLPTECGSARHLQEIAMLRLRLDQLR